jgi:vitamin B12 transporter
LSAWSVYSRNQFSAPWLARFSVAQGVDNIKSFLDGSPTGRFKTTSDQFQWQNEIVLAPGHRVSAGVEYLRQKVVSSVAFEKNARDVVSPYASYFAESGPHTLQLNARHDHYYSKIGAKTTGLAGYGFKLTPSVRLSTTLSTAFKAPTFNELYYPNGGNADLRPERANSAEIGVQYVSAEHSIKAVYFAQRIDDLITIVQVTPPDNFRSENIDRSKIDGIELSYSGRVLDCDLQASLTLQDPVDRSTGARLLRRAKSFGALALSRSFGAWRFGGEIQASGNRIDIPIDAVTGNERVTLPGYAVVNLTAQYRFGENTTAALRFENLLDKDYQLAHGYNVQRRAVFASLSHRFR